MRRLLASILLTVACSGAGGLLAQTTIDAAREEGRNFGKDKRADESFIPDSDGAATEVPGYAGTELPERDYYDNPDSLDTDGRVKASTDDAYGTIVDKDRTRASFTESEILAVTARGTAIESNPNTYLEGEALGGTEGSCTPLPPPNGSKEYYEATCNQGAKLTQVPQTCTGRMVPTVVNTTRFYYYGAADNKAIYGFAKQSVMQAKVGAGMCRAEPGTRHLCDAQIELGAGGDNVEAYRRFCKRQSATNVSVQLYFCSAAIPGGEIPDHRNYATGQIYLRTEGSVSVTVARNEGTCPALAGDPDCTATGPEVCTEGPETRVVDGVSVTQSCWAWSRPFMCNRVAPASDCGDLESNKTCSFLRGDCLDDPREGACKVAQKVYSCPLPDDAPVADKEYVCGGDVYCINGDCETIEREASTEFKDALVALHAMGDAGKEFDPDELTVFSGERGACSKKIFGASNCCSGKGVPLLTPWLCSAADRALDQKDDKGLCHKVGTYCADSILGLCVTSRDAYCCFGSKLSRILQTQGREQIGKPWGKPKDEQCKGFTIEEFQRLDLSKMDFTEVYAEFAEAAKLPDEVATMTDIQDKIQGYYELHGGK